MKESHFPTTFNGGLRRVVSECAELIHAITKLEQFGPVATDPETGKVYNNIRDVLSEMYDVEHAIAGVRLGFAKINSTLEAPQIAVQDFYPEITLSEDEVFNAIYTRFPPPGRKPLNGRDIQTSPQ